MAHAIVLKWRSEDNSCKMKLAGMRSNLTLDAIYMMIMQLSRLIKNHIEDCEFGKITEQATIQASGIIIE